MLRSRIQPTIPQEVNVIYRSHSGLTLILSIRRLLTPHYHFQRWIRKVPRIRNRSIQEEEVLPLSLPRRGELCKFPPPLRRRFSLIADRSPRWVINVQHGQSEATGQQRWWRENCSRGKEQSSGKIGGKERKNGRACRWRNRSVDMGNEKTKKKK